MPVRRLDPVAVMSGSAARSGRFPTRAIVGVCLSRAAATIAWKDATMAKATTLVGFDVHAAKIAAAVLNVENGEVRSYRPPGDLLECGAFCSGLARQ
jgi:hypothetical protein